MSKKFVLGFVVLFVALTACTPAPAGSLPTDGVWRASHSFDPNQGQPTTTYSIDLHKFTVTGGSTSGFVYFCITKWQGCDTKGWPSNGTVSSNGAAKLTFAFTTASGKANTVEITGTFFAKNFIGRFRQTEGNTVAVGTYNMAWYQANQ